MTQCGDGANVGMRQGEILERQGRKEREAPWDNGADILWRE